MLGGSYTPTNSQAIVGLLYSAAVDFGNNTFVRMRRGATSLTPALERIADTHWNRQLFLNKPGSAAAQEYRIQAMSSMTMTPQFQRRARAGSSLTVFEMPDGTEADILTTARDIEDTTGWLSVTITPRTAMSKIKLDVLLMRASGSDAMGLYRGGMLLVAPREGLTIVANVSGSAFPGNFQDWIDEPGTTAPVTYTVRSTSGSVIRAVIGSYLMAQEVGP